MNQTLKISNTTGEHKVKHGQFFTIGNPFLHEEFVNWKAEVIGLGKTIEPFAGSCNLVKMNTDLDFDSYDIEPQCHGVIQRDTIIDFPTGYASCITNPPYLAKNSAVQKGMIEAKMWDHDDLYKVAIKRCLQNCDYVAAIIPESFITSGFETQRLRVVISITSRLFEDTECPVCLALFEPRLSLDFKIYRDDVFVGNYLDMVKHQPPKSPVKFRFNDPDGILGIYCLDTSTGPSIRFVRGYEIESSSIKHYSRAYSRISGDGLTPENIDSIIQTLNKTLSVYRETTQDVFMTSFKGLRKDGRYRRRLSFDTIQNFIGLVVPRKTDLSLFGI